MKCYTVLALLLLLSCNKPETSFEKLYFVKYYWRVTDMPKPLPRVTAYLEYTHSLTALNANRDLPGSGLKFHEVDLSKAFTDSLERLSDTTNKDISYTKEVDHHVLDESSYAIIVMKSGKPLVIGFLRSTLPSKLSLFFQTLRRHSENEKHEIPFSDTTRFGKLESLIMTKSSVPQPPPVKTLKYVAPKVVPSVEYDDSIPPIDSLVKEVR